MEKSRSSCYPLCFVVPLLLLSFGCHTRNKAQKGAAIGAGAGGSVGAVIGKSAGNTALGALIGGAVGGTAGSFIGSNMDRQADQLREAIPGAEIIRIGQGIIVRFNSGILFNAGSADIREAGRVNLKNLALSLRNNAATNALIIGHTDNTGDPASNLDLSLKRAQSVQKFLVAEGVESFRLATVGKGETEPIADNSSEAGRQQNRRVEIVIIATTRMKAPAGE